MNQQLNFVDINLSKIYLFKPHSKINNIKSILKLSGLFISRYFQIPVRLPCVLMQRKY